MFDLERFMRAQQHDAIDSARFWLNETVLLLPTGMSQRYQEMAVRGQYFARLAERLNLTPAELDAHLTGLLAEAGYGSATFEQVRSAERVISDAFDRGRDTGVWVLDDDGVRQFAIIATTYDYQLQRAPLSAIAEASDRLDRFRAGESLDHVARKRA